MKLQECDFQFVRMKTFIVNCVNSKYFVKLKKKKKKEIREYVRTDRLRWEIYSENGSE